MCLSMLSIYRFRWVCYSILSHLVCPIVFLSVRCSRSMSIIHRSLLFCAKTGLAVNVDIYYSLSLSCSLLPLSICLSPSLSHLPVSFSSFVPHCLHLLLSLDPKSFFSPCSFCAV